MMVRMSTSLRHARLYRSQLTLLHPDVRLAYAITLTATELCDLLRQAEEQHASWERQLEALERSKREYPDMVFKEDTPSSEEELSDEREGEISRLEEQEEQQMEAMDTTYIPSQTRGHPWHNVPEGSDNPPLRRSARHRE